MGKDHINVVCFYWIGDRWQDDGMGTTYVNNLFRGVSRNLDRPFDFICFTNEKLAGLDKDIIVRGFNTPTETGVLPRIYMYSEHAGLYGSRVLALDLDIIIVGSLNDIADYDGLFCARSKFAPGQQHKLDGDIMSFKACRELDLKLFHPFVKDVKQALRITGGRERYWYRHVFEGEAVDRWDKVCPGQVVSYKRNVRTRKNKLPANARIVSCHGDPRPHVLAGKFDWAKRNWK